MSLKVNLSKKPAAILKRMKALPQLVDGALRGTRKLDAIGFIKTFQDGLKENSFGLASLDPKTIERKNKLGYDNPNSPLYGKGDREKNSYYNMWVIFPTANGYVVRPRNAKHWKSDLKLKDLFAVHEFGRTIQIGDRIIVLKPRPAGKIAFDKYLKTVSKKDTSQKVKRAITKYIKSGDLSLLNTTKDDADKLGKKFES